jgi:hypothetical protein
MRLRLVTQQRLVALAALRLAVLAALRLAVLAALRPAVLAVAVAPVVLAAQRPAVPVAQRLAALAVAVAPAALRPAALVVPPRRMLPRATKPTSQSYDSKRPVVRKDGGLFFFRSLSPPRDRGRPRSRIEPLAFPYRASSVPVSSL